MTHALTLRQLQVLTFVQTYTAEHGCGPSKVVVGRAFGLSSSRANELLCQIRRKGFVAWPKRGKGAMHVVANQDSRGRFMFIPIRSCIGGRP